MLLIVALIIVGILLIGAELFIPGGILGFAGGLCILAACYYTFVGYGMFMAVWVFIGALVVSCGLIYFEFKLLKRTRFGQRIFLSSVSGGEAESLKKSRMVSESVMGKSAKTLTTLAPSGRIEIEGQMYEAFSQDGLIRKGRTVKIVAQDSYRLIVKND